MLRIACFVEKLTRNILAVSVLMWFAIYVLHLLMNVRRDIAKKAIGLAFVRHVPAVKTKRAKMTLRSQRYLREVNQRLRNKIQFSLVLE